VESKLGLKFLKRDEMFTLITGLLFLLENAENETFLYAWEQDIPIPVQSPKGYLPFLLVNIGSGVSILKVDSPTQYVRVGGSSVGGGTFFGLCRLLTDIKSWDEVVKIGKEGDNSKVDLLVGDIYGGDYDSNTFNLPAHIIASSFGKPGRDMSMSFDNLGLPSNLQKDYNKADIIRSLLTTISVNITQIAYLNAKLQGVDTLIFAGGFVQKNKELWKACSKAVEFWSNKKMKAVFLQHDGYMGALGTFLMHNTVP